MKTLLLVIATVAISIFNISIIRASEPTLNNSDLDDGSGKLLPGWQLNNANAITADDGKTVVLLPGEFPGRFGKLWQRLPFHGNAHELLRVTIRVRTLDRVDADSVQTSDDKPRLRIYFFPEDTSWKQDQVIWPDGKLGAYGKIEINPDWHEVKFELPCPESARNVEIAVEVNNPPYAIEVDQISIEPVPRS